MYTVKFGTGRGDFTAETLAEAKEKADFNAAYTERDILIVDEDDKIVAFRYWFEPHEFDRIADRQKNPIRFGVHGMYGDWNFEDLPY